MIMINSVFIMSLCLFLHMADFAGQETLPWVPHIDHTRKIVYSPNRIRLLKAYAEVHYGEYYKQVTGSPQMPGIVIDPKVIVVHYTAVPTLEATLRVFQPETLRGRSDINQAGNANVGVQFVVDRDGTIHQIMADNFFARHCIGLNHCAIGIENIGMGDITEAALRGETQSDQNLTPAQVNSNIRLVRYLKKKYPAIKMLIGHMEYRQLEEPAHPGHRYFQEADPNYRTAKTDPGPRFMKALRMGMEDLLEPDSRGQVFR